MTNENAKTRQYKEKLNNINQVSRVTATTSNEDKYLTFSLANEYYAIDIKQITEIVGITTITELPNMPDYLKGLINLRGKVVPVIDIRLKFGMDEKDYDERTCIIIIDNDNKNVGIIVDNVSEVYTITEENISQTSKTQHKSIRQFIKGFGKVGNSVKIIIDTDSMLGNNLDEANETTA